VGCKSHPNLARSSFFHDGIFESVEVPQLLVVRDEMEIEVRCVLSREPLRRHWSPFPRAPFSFAVRSMQFAS